jgi:arylamine N-acetyltransferase
MPSASRHPKFTLEEVNQYYDRLHIAQEQRIFDVTPLSPENALEQLALLQRQHLAWVPFENLSLHYSRWRQISLHPEDLFKKIVQSPGRGGYCMENNALFAILLRTLGYKVRSCGARTHDGKLFGGWYII